MRAFVLGAPDDVRGLALVGVAGRVCRTAGEAARALGEALAPEVGTALLLVSADVHRLVARDLEALRERVDAPLVLILPSAGGEAP